METETSTIVGRAEGQLEGFMCEARKSFPGNFKVNQGKSVLSS